MTNTMPKDGGASRDIGRCEAVRGAVRPFKGESGVMKRERVAESV